MHVLLMLSGLSAVQLETLQSRGCAPQLQATCWTPAQAGRQRACRYGWSASVKEVGVPGKQSGMGAQMLMAG